MPRPFAMIDGRPGMPAPFDEEKLQIVREFLRREFQGCRHRDYFEFHTSMQVFVIEPEKGVWHIPRHHAADV